MAGAVQGSSSGRSPDDGEEGRATSGIVRWQKRESIGTRGERAGMADEGGGELVSGYG